MWLLLFSCLATLVCSLSEPVLDGLSQDFTDMRYVICSLDFSLKPSR